MADHAGEKKPPTPVSAPSRRSVLLALAAGTLGALAGVLALVPGVAVFFDPLRRTKAGGGKAVRVATLAAVPPDGLPHRFPVIEARSDAWTHYGPEPVGAVFLVRKTAEETPRCYSAVCPHLGCAVEFKPARGEYLCPCHNSAFALDGQKLYDSPSPRPLDELPVEIRNGTEVWVVYKRFRSGIKAQVES